MNASLGPPLVALGVDNSAPGIITRPFQMRPVWRSIEERQSGSIMGTVRGCSSTG